MKYFGQSPRRCDCRYCVGNGDSKAVCKALKKKERQKAKRDILADITNRDDQNDRHDRRDDSSNQD